MPAFASQEQTAYGLRPSKIQPTAEGYLLRVKVDDSTTIPPKPLPTILSWSVTVIVLGLFRPALVPILVIFFVFRFIQPFSKLTLGAVRRHTGKDNIFNIHWLILYFFLLALLVTGLSFVSPSPFILYIVLLGFISYILFGIIYWSLRLFVDRNTRQRLGFKESLDKLEVIFSHYPPRVGDGDRLTIRRSLKETLWAKFCNLDGFPKDSQINVDLVCIERVTYTQGTDSITDMAEVYRQSLQITPLIPGDRQISCHFDLTIPPHLAPSLEGKQNQIRWLLNVIEIYPNLLENKVSYLTFVVDP